MPYLLGTFIVRQLGGFLGFECSSDVGGYVILFETCEKRLFQKCMG